MSHLINAVIAHPKDKVGPENDGLTSVEHYSFMDIGYSDNSHLLDLADAI